jgi:hypothetical protein
MGALAGDHGASGVHPSSGGPGSGCRRNSSTIRSSASGENGLVK